MTITDSRGLLQIFERNIDINYPDALGSVHFAKEIGNLMISMFGGIRCVLAGIPLYVEYSVSNAKFDQKICKVLVKLAGELNLGLFLK